VLIERIANLLLEQAKARDAPPWLQALVTGEAEPTEIRDESDTILDVRRNSESCEVHIQLVLPAQAPETRGPWAPGGLDLSEAELARLSYIVIDEIVEEIISVSVSAWPRVDDRGRLVFSDDPSVSVWADASALRRYLERTAFGDAGELRRLRMGDTFAARVRASKLGRTERAGSGPAPPSAWIIPPVYDLRGQARDKAKEAFYAAVSPVLTPEQMKEMTAVQPPGAAGS
jgi:hypothetical protein